MEQEQQKQKQHVCRWNVTHPVGCLFSDNNEEGIETTTCHNLALSKLRCKYPLCPQPTGEKIDNYIIGDSVVYYLEHSDVKSPLEVNQTVNVSCKDKGIGYKMILSY